MSADAPETREEFAARYGAVAQYDEALAALATATLAESQEMLAKGGALELYAKRARDPDLLDNAVALSLAAQRRAGELLRRMADEGARDAGKGGDRKSRSRETTVKLSDLGVTKDQSVAWQKLAGLSLPDFEEAVAARQKDARRALAGSRAERAAAKKEKRAAREEELGAKISALPDKRYGVIYADPEWRFETRSEKGLDRAADNHYPTSALADICARDVASIAADDCVLFLWVTTPMLGVFPDVLAAWGFAYKSCIVWAKDRAGTGYWTRDKAEHLVIATRGSPPCPAPGDQCESLIAAPVGAHSAKPDVFAEMIEAMFPTLPKIELNRRGPPRPGWEAWGNEAEGEEADGEQG